MLLLRYVMKPYTTGGLCALDQDGHKTCDTSLLGLETTVSHECLASTGSQFAHRQGGGLRARASWQACGFDPGMPLQRDKVLIERPSEVIHSVRGKAGTLSRLKSKNQKALDIVATISPRKPKL